MTKAPTMDQLLARRSWLLDQRGKPYVFGAAGPNAYDCSGLSMAFWHSLGFYLPHYSAAQFDVTERVYHSGLIPRVGDLLLYYQPISHVGIFIGWDSHGVGLSVQATNPARGVELIQMNQFTPVVAWGRVRGS